MNRIVLASLCFLVGCSTELPDAESTWLANKPTEYSFTLTIKCFCPKNDKSVRLSVNGSTEPGTAEDVRTIDDLFRLARMEYPGYSATVDLDPDFFFPTLIELEADHMDAFVEYLVTDFTVPKSASR